MLAVILEGRTHAEVARDYEVSESTVSRWLERYRTDGDDAFEPRSRRRADHDPLAPIPHAAVGPYRDRATEVTGRAHAPLTPKLRATGVHVASSRAVVRRMPPWGPSELTSCRSPRRSTATARATASC